MIGISASLYYYMFVLDLLVYPVSYFSSALLQQVDEVDAMLDSLLGIRMILTKARRRRLGGTQRKDTSLIQSLKRVRINQSE